MAISFNKLGLVFKLFSPFFYSRNAIRGLRRVMNGLESGSWVVDLGGGTGTLSRFAHSMGPDLRYICVDPAHGMLKYVDPYALRVMARGEALPFKDHVIGAVLIGDALHHFSRPNEGIDEVRRTLQTGGKLFIFDINCRAFLGRLLSLVERLLGEPAHFYGPDDLKALLTAHGFTVLTLNRAWRYTVEAESE